MCRAVLNLVIMLVFATPMVVGQTAPAPPPTPAPAPRPARRAYSSDQDRVRVYRMSGSYLGIEPRDLTSDRVSALKLKSDKGVEVMVVDRDSPAGKAGLKEHDVILTFNGSPVDDSAALRKLLRETPPDKPVALGISRDGQPVTLNVTLAGRNSVMWERLSRMPNMPPMPKLYVPMPEMPDIPSFTMLQFSGRNGILVEELTAQLGDYFGVKNGEGVLVRSIEKGSPGEAAGLKAGDVIVRVGTDRINDMGDWRRFMRRHQGETVQLGVIRDKRDVTLSLTVPPRRQTNGSSSLEYPGLDLDLRDLNAELERLRPEIERANKEYMAQLQHELDLSRADIERASKVNTEELQRELRLHQHDIDEARTKAMQDVQRWMQEHRKDMENLQRDLEKMREQLQKQFRYDFDSRQ